ncbi:hypothetical protein ABZZ74_30785 [Streptomyces sp. NPDC006476]|uniref:hypothetical protein n=1 Tax=Streptomyces sp. NPDC006476 TaxID=3157175 RepID=UPI0033BDCF04
MAARYLPSGGDAEVGGDWFDVIPLPGARVGLVVGHGINVSATIGPSVLTRPIPGHRPAPPANQQWNPAMPAEQYGRRHHRLLAAQLSGLAGPKPSVAFAPATAVPEALSVRRR